MAPSLPACSARKKFLPVHQLHRCNLTESLRFNGCIGLMGIDSMMTRGAAHVTKTPGLPAAGRWHAVSTRPHNERLAAAHLERQGFNVFLPLRVKTVRHARQFRTVHAPLFPGYLFVQLDLAHQQWRSVNGTRGVVSLVMCGERPAVMPQGVVECLHSLSTGGGLVQFDSDLNIGQRVRILAGPFAEHIGTLRHMDDRGRVSVLLEMMGSHVPVVSALGQLACA